mgnify:CR=1 FL=1
MAENEILIKWKQGLSKDLLAKIYRREYNQKIKIIRSSVRHRHDGKMITNYEALRKVEQVIYKYLRERR